MAQKIRLQSLQTKGLKEIGTQTPLQMCFKKPGYRVRNMKRMTPVDENARDSQPLRERRGKGEKGP